MIYFDVFNYLYKCDEDNHLHRLFMINNHSALGWSNRCGQRSIYTFSLKYLVHDIPNFYLETPLLRFRT